MFVFDALTPTVRIGKQDWPVGAIIDLPEAARQQEIIDLNPLTGPAEFAAAAAPILGTGEGKTVLLYKAVAEVAGAYIVLKQQIGDCVDNSHCNVVNHLLALAIKAGEPFEWVAETARGPIYAGSRVEVGGGRISGDGSQGAWAARFLTEWGAIPLGKYGEIDLTRYDPGLSRRWGAPGRGVPDELEPVLKQYPIKTASRVRTWEEARDALANAYPVNICSDQGFTQTRDKDGFCRASGSWSHSMVLLGVRADRPGALVQNSWGDTGCRGPKALDQPEGSFWADASTIDRICRGGDCWAFSGAVGFPKRTFDLDPLS